MTSERIKAALAAAKPGVRLGDRARRGPPAGEVALALNGGGPGIGAVGGSA